VDTDAIALKVKQEFASKARKQTMKKDATKAPARATEKDDRLKKSLPDSRLLKMMLNTYATF